MPIPVQFTPSSKTFAKSLCFTNNVTVYEKSYCKKNVTVYEKSFSSHFFRMQCFISCFTKMFTASNYKKVFLCVALCSRDRKMKEKKISFEMFLMTTDANILFSLQKRLSSRVPKSIYISKTLAASWNSLFPCSNKRLNCTSSRVYKTIHPLFNPNQAPVGWMQIHNSTSQTT